MPIVSHAGRCRATGRRGECLAAEHMRRLGFAVLDSNVRTGVGEIDLIAGDGRRVVFVEVKTTRTAGSPAHASAARAAERVLERLGPRQRRRLRGLALDWLRAHSLHAGELRFDAIGIVLDESGELLALEHLEAAW